MPDTPAKHERSESVDKARQIREHMPVVCSNNKQFGTVDHVEGNYIKLTKNSAPDGQHHWIPVDWVTRVDNEVHVDRPGDQAMRQWLSSPPPTTQDEMAASAPM
jgi:hypothetical protein